MSEKIQWTKTQRNRVWKKRKMQAKLLRVLARELGAKTKTEAKRLLRESAK